MNGILVLPNVVIEAWIVSNSQKCRTEQPTTLFSSRSLSVFESIALFKLNRSVSKRLLRTGRLCTSYGVKSISEVTEWCGRMKGRRRRSGKKNRNTTQFQNNGHTFGKCLICNMHKRKLLAMVIESRKRKKKSRKKWSSRHTKKSSEIYANPFCDSRQILTLRFYNFRRWNGVFLCFLFFYGHFSNDNIVIQ